MCGGGGWVPLVAGFMIHGGRACMPLLGQGGAHPCVCMCARDLGPPHCLRIPLTLLHVEACDRRTLWHSSYSIRTPHNDTSVVHYLGAQRQEMP